VTIDHVIFIVDDLDAASDALMRNHGLASVAGGRHAGHGTANRIVPLVDSYLELMGVVDRTEAEASPMGRWAMAQTAAGLHPAALCLRTDDADAEGARLGLEPVAMTRTRPDGVVLSWRLVGANEMFGPLRLPFFIQWDDLALHPGRSTAPHGVVPNGIASIELTGDRRRIEERLGRDDLPIVVGDGEPGVRRVVVATEMGEIAL